MRHARGSFSAKFRAWRERDDGGGGGGKSWSKKGPVTRDGIYERPLSETLCTRAWLGALLVCRETNLCRGAKFENPMFALMSDIGSVGSGRPGCRLTRLTRNIRSDSYQQIWNYWIYVVIEQMVGGVHILAATSLSNIYFSGEFFFFFAHRSPKPHT